MLPLTTLKEKALFWYGSYFNRTSFSEYKLRYLRDALIIGSVIAVVAVFLTANAATYTFVQTSWSGGATGTNANHASNRTGWNQYSAKDSTTALVNSSADIELLSTAASSTQTSATDFTIGTLSNVTVTGTGSAGQVELLPSEVASPWTPIAGLAGVNGALGVTYSGSGDFAYALIGGTSNLRRYSISGDSWTSLANPPIALGEAVGVQIVHPGGDFVYILRGDTTKDFYRYSISGNSWTTLASTTMTMGISDAFAYAGGDYLYAFRGNTTDFWRYSISGNTWTSLASTTFSGGNTRSGSRLVYTGGDYLYSFRGNSGDFARYSISGNSWTNMSTLPVSVGGGDSLLYPGSGDYLYALPTSSSNNAQYKYSISGNTWTRLPGLPKFVSSAGGAFVVGGYIYEVNTGNTPTTGAGYKYSIALGETGTGWTTITMPWTIGSGVGMVSTGGDYLYVIFGGSGIKDFYRYSISGNSWTAMASTTESSAGGITPLNYPGTGDYIYALSTNSNRKFYRYSISGNSWSELALVPTVTSANMASLVGIGDYIYTSPGNSGSNGEFYRYSISGNSWTAMASSTLTSSQGKIVYPGSGDYIYQLANGFPWFVRYSISGNTWSAIGLLKNAPWFVSSVFHLAYTGLGDYFYGLDHTLMRYSISTDTWQELPLAPATVARPILVYPGSGSYLYATADTSSNLYRFNFRRGTDPGTFTSSVIDTGNISQFSTLSYTKTTPTNTTLTVDVRGGNTSSPDGTWTSWQTGIANGGSLSALNDTRYVQYRATLNSTDTSVTPTLSDVTFNYSNYATSTTLTSSPFDSSSSGNILASIAWTGSAPTGTAIKFQIRSAPDATGVPGTWSSYMGPDGTSGTYFTSSDGSDVLPAVLKDATNDQWFQYKVFLTTTRAATPTLSDVTVTYVVNNPPSFDATFGTGGTIVDQIATSTDPNYGKVHIQYKIKDADTTTGSITPGFVTPSFEYNIGGGWVSIPTINLSASATSNKAVSEGSYATYEAYFDAKTLIPETYTASAQIRVKINDNEGANNITYATSSAFVLDTKNAVVSSIHIDGTSATNTVSFAATDNTLIRSYIVSNNSNFTADGLNAISGIAQTVNNASLSINTSWVLTGTSSKIVYLKLEDVRGNITTTSVTVPATPSNMEYRDISSIDTGVYRMFVAWNLYPSPAPAGAPYNSYKLYRSTDGIDFSLVYTSTNPTINYYIDTAVATTTTYYYKVAFTTSNGDTTIFSPTVSDMPDGKGGTNNGAVPLITNVAVTDIKNTSVKVTWNTDDLALSDVDFGTTISYGQVASSRSYVTDHVVYLTGLVPNTQYYARVRSTDAFSGTATKDNGGAGYTFTTGGGPVVSNVTVSSVSDVTADIVWNTSTSSDSHVSYSTSPTLATYTEVGNDTFVEAPFQHKVTLTGLTTDTTYYFKVSSKDADNNTTTDTNNDSYYQFKTTHDTKAPVITDVVVPVRAATGVVVTWATDELSTSQVEYSTASGTPYAFKTVEITTPSIFHSVTLSGETTKEGGGSNLLVKTTNYYYRVKSHDSAGNTSYSPQGMFVTTEEGAIAAAGGGFSTNFEKDTTKPTISDVKISGINPFGAIVSFTTDEDTRAIVQYGDTATYTTSVGNPDFSQTHSLQVKGLRMGTTYHISASVVDKSGNVSTSPDMTFKTTNLAENLGNLLNVSDGLEGIQQKIEDLIESALPSINPPFIENPIVESLGEDFATITWRTNVKSYGSVSFAEDKEFVKTGQYSSEVIKADEKLTAHALDISGLKPNTKYHYKIRSYVFLGAPGESKDYTFITKASGVQAQIVDRKKDSFRVIWTTPQPTTSIVSYKKRGAQSANRKMDDSMTTSHDIKLENLTPASVYEVRVFGTTEEGNTVEAKNAITVSTNQDTTAPLITNFKVDSALVPGRTDRTQTIVSWKTDEPATSAVYYEEGSGSSAAPLSNKKEDLTTYVDNHVVILTSLKPGAIYRFQIVSTDDANNTTKLPVRTIVTPSQSESVVDVIFKNFDDTFKFLRTVQ